jgi:hypothetical protein
MRNCGARSVVQGSSRARVIKSRRVGSGRLYAGAETAQQPQREPVVIPTLTVASFKALTDTCR